MEYSHVFGSTFPESAMSVGTKKDVDNTVGDLVTQFYAYLDVGNRSAAYNVYEQNKDVLEAYGIFASDFNRLEEEIYNAAAFALNQSDYVISTTEPTGLAVNSTWLQAY